MNRTKAFGISFAVFLVVIGVVVAVQKFYTNTAQEDISQETETPRRQLSEEQKQRILENLASAEPSSSNTSTKRKITTGLFSGEKTSLSGKEKAAILSNLSSQ